MAQEDPDIAALFAPLRPAQASDVVLREAREVLAHLHKPIDAELWGSDIIGALSGGGPDGADRPDVMAELTASLVPAAEESATPEALALLRILAAIGSAALEDGGGRGGRAGNRRRRRRPGLGGRHRLADGREVLALRRRRRPAESITVSFGYGDAEHALSVLIDHGQGGKIKDAWVDDAEGLLDKTWMAAENDPLIVFEPIEPADARARLENAVAAGECPGKPDEVDDLTAHRALLRARVRYLATAA